MKSTYSAEVRVPGPLTALMSAVAVGDPTNNGDGTVFKFEQKVPLFSSLVIAS